MDNEYCLWLLPEEKIYSKYLGIISQIASKYQTKKFIPHVTLIKRLSIKEKNVISLTDKFVKSLEPVKIKFEKFGYTERKYRCLFISVSKTPEIRKAHIKANEIFKHIEELFLPHLSIIYGSLPIEIKREISESLKPLEKDSFILNRLVIYETGDKNEDLWKEVKRYNLD